MHKCWGLSVGDAAPKTATEDGFEINESASISLTMQKGQL